MAGGCSPSRRRRPDEPTTPKDSGAAAQEHQSAGVQGLPAQGGLADDEMARAAGADGTTGPAVESTAAGGTSTRALAPGGEELEGHVEEGEGIAKIPVTFTPTTGCAPLATPVRTTGVLPLCPARNVTGISCARPRRSAALEGEGHVSAHRGDDIR